MTNRLKILLVIMTVSGIYVSWDYWLRSYVNRITIETPHYTIYSTATQAQTRRIEEAAESLYSAYTTFFKDRLNMTGQTLRLKMNFYKDKQEFTKHNRSSSWAEAFYQKPYCYAYYPEGESNSYHWMIHEGVHQLNNEVGHFKVPSWIDEGLATYFGTSKIINGKLLSGQIDANTYPIWWLPRIVLTGNLQNDIKNKKIIPLRAVITGSGGPDINKQFNLYYIHYWSLTHFLFNYNNGKYSVGYKNLITDGGSLNDFEKRIGPIDLIQNEWYEYLQQKIKEIKK